jgi:hypothetical protein
MQIIYTFTYTKSFELMDFCNAFALDDKRTGDDKSTQLTFIKGASPINLKSAGRG